MLRDMAGSCQRRKADRLGHIKVRGSVLPGAVPAPWGKVEAGACGCAGLFSVICGLVLP